jgi:hypothetical protein
MASSYETRQGTATAGSSASIHKKAYDTVITSGGVEALVFALGAGITSAFIATRQNDLQWGLGIGVLSFFVAGGSRSDSAIRDAFLGALGGSGGYLGVRAVGHFARSSNQD